MLKRRFTQPSHLLRARKRRGMTLVELLVIVGIVAILFAVLLPVFTRVRQSQRSVECLSTLGDIAQAFQSYAMQHKGRFPDPGKSDRSWEQILMTCYQGRFQCPADEELFPAIGSSYDWRDTGNDSTTLAGKLLISVSRPNAILVFDALPGWHGKRTVNAARLDGSAGPVDEVECFRELATPLWHLK